MGSRSTFTVYCLKETKNDQKLRKDVITLGIL